MEYASKKIAELAIKHGFSAVLKNLSNNDNYTDFENKISYYRLIEWIFSDEILENNLPTSYSESIVNIIKWFDLWYSIFLELSPNCCNSISRFVKTADEYTIKCCECGTEIEAKDLDFTASNMFISKLLEWFKYHGFRIVVNDFEDLTGWYYDIYERIPYSKIFKSSFKTIKFISEQFAMHTAILDLIEIFKNKYKIQ